MGEVNKNKISYRILLLSGMIVFLHAFFGFCVKADSISDISGSGEISEETQEKLDELKRKAEIYRQIIEIKEKQGESLSNQLSITDTNIQQVQAQIDLSMRQIEEYNSQILRLEQEIKEKTSLIESQKKLLGNIVRSYYEISQAGLLPAYLSNENIASFMANKDRISQTGDKVKELVSSIAEIKKNLESQMAEVDERKSKIVETSQKLKDQNSNLESVKTQRKALLTQTQGEEEKYRKLLENIEKQKQELLDIDQFFAASGLSVDSYPKPPSSTHASTSWYYSQRDSKWGNDNIGNTKTLMKNYGCAVTSVAMVFKKHGGSMDPGDLADQSIFYGDLINWPSPWKNPKVSLISSKSHGNVSWSTIDSSIKKDIPVIIYIKKSNGRGGHYVVVHHKESGTGKYVVHDPYFGPNLYLETSRALVGAMGTSSSTSIDQMIIYN